ncbi:MAG: DUF6198 family protein [Firmicutes bacterium]|nr:DUF6198 family protein [Bacillota bacterium]
MDQKFILRHLTFLIGLFLTAIGISFTIKIGIGSTPMSIVPLFLSNVFPFTFGQMNFIWSLSFVFGQMFLLGKGFKKEQYLQFLICPLFGFFIDIGLLIFKNYSSSFYFLNILAILSACIIIAFGVNLQVMANVIINPGEGIVNAIAYRTKIKFGNVKIMFDTSVMVLGIILSIIFLNKIIGVGVGTLIIALATGSIVKFFKWVFELSGIEKLYESQISEQSL